MPDLTDHSLGRYHILEQLGEGGMATVYKAYDTRLETEVAVKVIRTENILPRILERTLKRFEREAKALAKLNHPNIVQVIDYGEYEDKPYLVMPYLPGGTLKERIRRGRIPWQETIRLLAPIARALEYAHRHKIIHRDIKPSNVLITDADAPMLSDFGVAKVLDVEETAELTGTGMGVGTPEYMAPEQFQGQTDARSDIYALGVVMYEMLTGRKPYIAETPAAVIIKQATEPLPRPSHFTPDLPASVEKILIKSLAKAPNDRYQNMGDFAQALEELILIQEREKKQQKEQKRKIELEKQKREEQKKQQELNKLQKQEAQERKQEQQRQKQEAQKKEHEQIKQRRLEAKKQRAPRKSSFVKMLLGGIVGLLILSAFGWFGFSGVFESSFPIIATKTRDAASTQVSITETASKTKVPVPTMPFPTEDYPLQQVDVAFLGVWSSGGMRIAWAPDGKLLASAIADNIQIWDPFTESLQREVKLAGFSNGEWILGLDWSPSGNQLAVSTNRSEFFILDTESLEVLRNISIPAAPTNISSLANDLWEIKWSPDGKRLAMVRFSGDIFVYDGVTGEPLLAIECGYSNCAWNSLAWSPDGNQIAVGVSDGVKIYDSSDGKLVDSRILGNGFYRALMWSPDGHFIVTTRTQRDKGFIYILDSVGGGEKQLVGTKGGPLSLSWSPSGLLLASASGGGTDSFYQSEPANHDTEVYIWDMRRMELITTLSGPAYITWSIEWSPDGNHLIAVNEGGLYHWEMTSISSTIIPATTTDLTIGSSWTRPEDSMTMMYVPAGEFEMGSNDGDEDEKPVHSVYLDAFWIDQTEVTNALYINCVEAGVCNTPSGENFINPAYTEYPVVNVSWFDANNYCEWAGGRLPTEAEWEKAARGGLDGKKYPWGEQIPTCQKGVINGVQYSSCDGLTISVGSFSPNGYSLYDMAGNVWEWVSSLYKPYPYSSKGSEAPSGSGYRVLRGGSFITIDKSLRTSYRIWLGPTNKSEEIGFRCARDIDS